MVMENQRCASGPRPGFGPRAQAIGVVFSVIFTVYMMPALWT